MILNVLIQLDPRRFLQVLHLPIRGMRVITDPIVDSVVYLFVKLFIPHLVNMVQAVLRLFMGFMAKSARGLLGSSTTSVISDFSARIVCKISLYSQSSNSHYIIQYSHSADLMGVSMAHLSVWSSASNLTVTSESSTVDFMSLPDYLGFIKPFFAVLRGEVRLYVTQVQSTWIRLALGSGPTNRVFAVCLGYIVVCLLFCLYLNILTVGNARNAGIVVRNAIRQQLLVLKVFILSFLFILFFADSLFHPGCYFHLH